MRSTRLPGKVLADIDGKPVIEYVLSRVARAGEIAELWLACSDHESDDALAKLAKKLGAKVFRGDEEDVLNRFVEVARKSKADALVRITGDCPFADPDVIDRVVARYRESEADYVSNTLVRSFPDGLDVEVFSRAALDRADREAEHPFLRAHVTPYIHGRLADRLPCGDFSRDQLVNETDFSHLRWTLDEPEDLEFFRQLVPRLPENFHWQEAVAEMTRHPDLFWINRAHRLNEGTARDLARLDGTAAPRRFDRSNELFARAQKMIPLASQTFSKSHIQVVRGASPLFIERGYGCRVVDVDGNEYLDYLMGLMPVILGYCDPDVDSAIRAQLEKGITFSLPSPLEAELAERLIRIVPCAERVRFGKNGSDVTSAAVRLARAFTGRDRIAHSGYHGWHDWCIGTTSRHLGVPDSVRALSTAFPFNDADALERLLAAEPDAFAAVVIEPVGDLVPEPGFLERIRELTSRFGIVLVFDEIISGFRAALGGAQERYGVVPDLAAFGKAMGNGMPISALVGRSDIMAAMDRIFFSTTFGGETLSLAAAIATIDKLEREEGHAKLHKRGHKLMTEANRALKHRGLGDIVWFGGNDWWPRMRLGDCPVEETLLRSLLRQEFFANGVFLLAGFNLCLAHDSDDVTDKTVSALDRAFADVRAALDSPDPRARLRGTQIQPTFAVR